MTEVSDFMKFSKTSTTIKELKSLRFLKWPELNGTSDAVVVSVFT